MNDRLTLVVFKDHLSSRTLTLRLNWLRGLGLALVSVIGLTVIAGALFFNAYRKNIHTGSLGTSLKTEEMEKELTETKAAYESLKNQAVGAATAGGASLAGASSSFSSLPSDAVIEKLPAPETLPFRLENLKAQWKGNILQIRSAIEYAREDGGNQQGHFVILVHGPQSVHAYPDGVFNPVETGTLIKPDGGEFFSVSRYREVKADFGPFAHRDDVQSIEIMIFDLRKRLVFLSRVGLETLTPKSAPAPKKPEKKAEPEEETTEAPSAGAPADPATAAPNPGPTP